MHARIAGLLICCTSLLTAACVADGTNGNAWPQWRGPMRNGIVPGEPVLVDRLPEEPNLVWETTILEGKPDTHASPAIAGGRVFVHSSVEQRYEENGKKRKRSVPALVCLSLADGAEQWRHQPENDCHNTPCVAGDRVLYVGGRGQLYCLATADGAVRWQAKVHKKNGTNCSPVVVGDRVVACVGRDLICLDLAGGDPIWKQRVQAWNNSPVVWEREGHPYLIVGNRELSCIDASDGRVLWTLAGTDRKQDPSSPAIHGDLMATLFEGGGLRVHRLSPTGAELVAEAEDFAPQGGGAHQADSPVFDGRRVYGVDGDKTFCFDIEQGAMAWTAKKGNTHASIILAGGKLIVRRKRSTMLLDAATGEELGENEMGASGCSSFAFSAGRLVANCGTAVRCWDIAGR